MSELVNSGPLDQDLLDQIRMGDEGGNSPEWQRPQRVSVPEKVISLESLPVANTIGDDIGRQEIGGDRPAPAS